MIRKDHRTLPHILNGTVIIAGSEMFISPDIHKTDEYIYLDINPQPHIDYAVHRTKNLFIPDVEGNLTLVKCVLLSNRLYNIVNKDNFTFIDKVGWTFYEKNLTIRN